MKKYLKEILILLLELFMFYIFPLFAGPTDAMGMVFLIILTTFVLSIIIGSISKRKIKFLYPILISILFIPSVFIYYNKSALIHSIWYLVISSIGLLIGILLRKIFESKKIAKKVIIPISIVISLFIIFLLIITRGPRTDVFLSSFELSSDGKVMTLNVGVSSSAGYVRKVKRTSGGMDYYLTFYSTFGINSKLGAKDTFEIEIDENVSAIYFYIGDNGYRQVLEKDENNNWGIVKEK